MTPLQTPRCLKGFNNLISCTSCNFSTTIRHISHLLVKSHFGIKHLRHTMFNNIEKMILNQNRNLSSSAEFGASLSNNSRLPCPRCRAVSRWVGGKIVSSGKKHFLWCDLTKGVCFFEVEKRVAVNNCDVQTCFWFSANKNTSINAILKTACLKLKSFSASSLIVTQNKFGFLKQQKCSSHLFYNVGASSSLPFFMP